MPDRVTAVPEWARTMTWKGVHPVVDLLDKTYDIGVRIAKAAFKGTRSRLERDNDLTKYELIIKPQPV